MTRKIVLRRSSREEILWSFHVVLDSVTQDDAGRTAFVSQLLRQFGVPWWRRRRLVALVCQKLPDDLGNTDMSEVMRAFETAISIEWDNDLTAVGAQTTAEFERSVLSILEVAAAKPRPDEVTALVIREVERSVGSPVARSLLPGVAKAIQTLLVRQLWQCSDRDACERLKDQLLFTLKSKARLDFAAQPPKD